VPEVLIVACPACNTLNRFPRERLADGLAGKSGTAQSGTAKCGNCRSPLFTGHPVALDAQSFEAHARKSDIPLLVDFWAPWCGPCKAMAPQFEKAAGRLEPGVRLAKVNTDEEQELAGRFSIQGIPTMILLKHGKEIARQSGMMDATRIEQWTAQALR
jgi:thioredoxin 2